MTAVLLLGASGFLGAHARAALAQDPRVTRVTCAGRDRIDVLTAGPDAFADLLAAERPDVVVNCTGLLDGTAAQLMAANTMVTAHLVDAIAAVRPGMRLVRIGSAGEYGPMPHGHAVREVDPAEPVSAYGLSHLSASRLVALASQVGRVDGVSLRVFNPIGAGLRGGTVLARAAEGMRAALAEGAEEIVLGPLDAYRDFVDARDVATAVLAAALVPELTASVLNIGSGQAVTTRDAVALLAEAAGFRGRIVEAPMPGGRSAAVGWSLADITLAEQVLGWRPAHTVSASVAAVWAAVSTPSRA
jgi:nucleoside-diphosphate-sugar epimerase